MTAVSDLRPTTVVFCAALLLSAALPVGADSSSSWPLFQNDAQNTGHQAVDSLPDQLDVLWRAQLSGGAKASPVVADGMVFIATDSGNLYALDARNGRTLWGPLALAEPAFGAPAYENGKLYVATSEVDGSAGRLYVIRADTGEYVQNVSLTKGSYGGVSIHDGKLFVGQDDGTLVAYDTESMTKLWAFSTAVKIDKAGVPAEGEGRQDCCARADIGARPIKAVPLVSDGRVYFGSFNHLLFAVSAGGTPGAETTKQIWVENLQDIIYSSAGIGRSPSRGHEMVVVGSYDGTIYSFDPSPLGTPVNCPSWPDRKYHPTGNDCSKRIHWTFQTGSRVFASPAFGSERAYIGDESGSIHGIWIDGGRAAWTFKTDGAIRSSAATAGNGIVVGSYDGNIYLFKEDGEGKLLAGYPKVIGLSDKIHSSPAIAGGKVFIATMDGTLFALGAPGTPVPPGGPDATSGLPDFQVHDLLLTPRKAVAGQPLEVSVGFSNLGGPSDGPLLLRLYDGDRLINQTEVEPSSTSHSFVFTPEAGDLFLRVVANEDGVRPEAKLDNNEIQQHHVAAGSPAVTEDGTETTPPEEQPAAEDEDAPLAVVSLFLATLAAVILFSRRLAL